MTFGAAIKKAFQNLTNFKGRARRSEFWWFYLFMTLAWIPGIFLVSIPLFVVGPVGTSLGSNYDTLTADQWSQVGTAFNITFGLVLVLGAITFLLLLAVWVRRLHDGGYSGHWVWFYLAGLGIVPLLMVIADGTIGPNRFGPDPKEFSALGGADVLGRQAR